MKCDRDHIVANRDVIVGICSRVLNQDHDLWFIKCGAFNKQETLTLLQRLLYVGLNLLTASEKMPTKHYDL